MTNFMNNLNEQLFQELDDEMAANLSGGKAVLYENSDLSGKSPQFFVDTPNLGNLGADFDFDGKTSAIYISPGEKWAFYNKANYKDYLTSLEGGTNGRTYSLSSLEKKGIPNDSITSLRKTAG
ncbi:MAG: Beta/Gamma crystallin [Cyanobacteriota bacterium]